MSQYIRFTKGWLVLLLLALICLSCLTGCSGNGLFTPPIPLPNDMRDIPEPKVRDYVNAANFIDKQITLQIEESLDLSRQFRNLTRNRKEAFNFNAIDEVDNSSWFTNRNAVERLSLEEISRGADTGDGPDTSGDWVITRAKTEGATPGFTIKDSRGDYYLIKFDPKGYSEMNTGAEIVATKIFYAAGYNVPENYITNFHPDILKLSGDVKMTDEFGITKLMAQADLDAILENVDRLKNGHIRAVASKYLSGKPKGPFAYQGWRKDDLNDIVPHQHRRELRGLRAITAWLSHVDTKSGNTLDMYVTENGKSFIKHYLIDFGSSLGSMASSPKDTEDGFENTIDPHACFTQILTLGFYVRPFEKLEKEEVQYAAIGRYESQIYNPGKYKYLIPNPAFGNATKRDLFWGAKIILSFTDEQLEAAVAQGQYSDPDAAAYLLRILKERRDKTCRYFFKDMNPLDKFKLSDEIQGKQTICFTDLAIDGGLNTKQETHYRYDITVDGKVIDEQEIGNSTCVSLPGNSGTSSGTTQWVVGIETYRESTKKWSKRINLYLTPDDATDKFNLLGIVRED